VFELGRAGKVLVCVCLVALVGAGCNSNILEERTTPPTASATPAQTVAAVTPTGTPTAPPTPTPDGRLEALWTLISDPTLSYHLSGAGASTVQGTRVERFTLELDISGDDYAGTVNSIGSSGKARLVRKDGVMYAKPAGSSKWTARRLTDSVIEFVPFLDISAQQDLQADGVQQKGQRTLYRYVSTGQYRPDVAHMMDLSRFTATCDVLRLELLVTDAAVPVSAHFECHVGNGTYDGTSDYTFTEFGKNFSIKPPVKPPKS
jgi:hypothetical protein